MNVYDKQDCLDRNTFEMKVIGNIYDNPELINNHEKKTLDNIELWLGNFMVTGLCRHRRRK